MLTADSIYVVVQFYPWFKFSFLLFQTHYHVIIIHYHTQKQKKRKFEPRVKLNHNIYTKELLTDWNFHIKNEHKSLKGWNPNFNFHVEQNLT